MKVRITQKNWLNFTGSFGTAQFVDGIADVAISEAMRLGALIEIRVVNPDGSDGEIISPSNDMLLTERLSAQVTPSRRIQTVEETPVQADDDIEPVEDDTEEAKVWTSKELEAVADEGGIAGLREIATPMGIKGTSIHGLIEAIINHQSN